MSKDLKRMIVRKDKFYYEQITYREKLYQARLKYKQENIKIQVVYERRSNLLADEGTNIGREELEMEAVQMNNLSQAEPAKKKTIN